MLVLLPAAGESGGAAAELAADVRADDRVLRHIASSAIVSASSGRSFSSMPAVGSAGVRCSLWATLATELAVPCTTSFSTASA
jgi:hypothetical protein